MNYNLICSAGHETTYYSPSIAAFEKARDHGFLECATCVTQGIKDSKVEQGLSLSNVNTGVTRDKSPSHVMIQGVRCEDVGDRFFETVLNINDGAEAERPIAGRISNGQAEALKEAGFEFRRIDEPKVN